MLLVDTGIRSGEVAALSVTDIDMKTGAIDTRQGKGGKGRIVFASNPTLESVRTYWSQRHALPDEPAITTSNK